MRIGFIGDAGIAAALGVVGVQKFDTAGGMDSAFFRARSASDLVVLDAVVARQLGSLVQQSLSEAPLPPVIVIPVLTGELSRSDPVVRRARRLLGLAAAQENKGDE
ncbi:MAG: hypothetical protein LJE84_06605 [Gammaproteobacteria bacterium]|jgi:vacuolar-type H+-ATPase subunit F/Vma7|nr:hypothetical protein [Gammaproteobacteria bacterium]